MDKVFYHRVHTKQPCSKRSIIQVFNTNSTILEVSIDPALQEVDPSTPEEFYKQYFHREYYYSGSWMHCGTHPCCRLCKTRFSAPRSRYKHWAQGLCRSCYRRLSADHRLYNDSWNEMHSATHRRTDGPKKKKYKRLNPALIKFSWADIDSLLDRYDWKCAYSGIQLQGYDHTRKNAFCLEYRVLQGNIILVPVAKTIICSKKHTQRPEKLKEWAKNKGLNYPFRFVDPPKGSSKGYFWPDSDSVCSICTLHAGGKESVL